MYSYACKSDTLVLNYGLFPDTISESASIDELLHFYHRKKKSLKTTGKDYSLPTFLESQCLSLSFVSTETEMCLEEPQILQKSVMLPHLFKFIQAMA